MNIEQKIIALLLTLITFNSSAIIETKTKVVYSDQIKIIANHWSIEPAEYNKSLELKKQYGNLITGKITPIEYLGIFAQNSQDRKKYAKIFAKMQHETTAKVLAFDTAFRLADKELYGSISLFNYKIKSKEKKRDKFTIDIVNCNQSCKENIVRLVNKAFFDPIDFYFLGATDSQIRSFAAKINIDIDYVERGLITLNHAK